MIATNKFVLTHVPRCGGTWIERTLQNGGLLEPAAYIKSHNPYPKEAVKDKLLFCFIRHPASWYASYWNRRMCLGWTECPFDSYKSDNLNTFVKNVLIAEKDYYSRMIKEYIENTSYVGKFEDLIEDLLHMLRISNSAFDTQAIRNAIPINCSNYEKYAAIYEKDTINQIQETEKFILETYYNNEFPMYFIKNREHGIIQERE